ncbi:MAG: aquaporin, partial [Clostridia bacterium]
MYCLGKKALAEFIGTFVLVFFACGTAIVTGANVVATALSFGLVIVAMAYSIGNVSGCHINPAVSIGMLVSGKMTVKEFLVYIAAQFLGAIVGAGVLYGLLTLAGSDFGMKIAGSQVWATNAMVGTGFGGIVASLGIEIVLTFVFVFAILGVTSKTENGTVAGIVIGLTLTLVHLIGINLTGTSVNPARSFGPALMSLVFGNGAAALSQVWIFIVAPLVGGALA